MVIFSVALGIVLDDIVRLMARYLGLGLDREL